MNIDLTYLSDCLFLFGALFFVVGMIIALFATSRWHYYRHLKEKWKGKIENDDAFDGKKKERRKQMWIGIYIASVGIVALTASGLIVLKIGF